MSLENSERPSFPLDDWCDHRRLSRSMFYKLERQGRAPKTYNVGSRRFVSAEADTEWQRQREAESAQAA